MPEFLELLPPLQALNKLLGELAGRLIGEVVSIHTATGRVLCAPVMAPYALPSFPRSTVDGYAVRAEDTYGASESLPAYLSLIGEVPMGGEPDFRISTASCALIHTGGMLPNGANAVVMVEYTQTARPGEVELLRAVAEGENVLHEGEDVRLGEQVIPTGSLLRPAEIGGLAALGITEVTVCRKPRVGIISTGDEVVPLDQALTPGQVHDVNTYTLSALVQNEGGIPKSYGILPDRQKILNETTQRALRDCDVVVITAGSSASTRDLTSEVVHSLGPPGVLVHGVNVRPGKPTILGVCTTQGQRKAVIGLPGNPVSALVIAGLFVVPVIHHLLGVLPRARPAVQAQLAINLSSQAGREDWVPVRLHNDPTHPFPSAEPVFGKSNLIFTLARADGLICIPADANGLPAGELVNVFLSY